MAIPKLTDKQVAALTPGYTDIAELAQGGFKTVFRAKIQGVSEAIKVIAIPGSVNDLQRSSDQDRYRDECIRRVEREVEILQRCVCPFLVKLGRLPMAPHRVHHHDYLLYSEEFLDGPNLWQICRGTGPRPSESEAKSLMKCLLMAIRDLWALKVIHRDIKPCNVIKLADPERPFVLLDLGIAFSLIETSVTFDGRAVATYRYLAPEMGDPNFRANLDYRADLYTSALTVFEYSTGEHPIAHDSDDAVHTITRALRQRPRSLATMRPEFSPEFTGLIDQLLKKRPALRPANLNQLIALMEV